MKTVLMVILLFMAVMICGCDETQPLKVGQVWEWEWNHDPFEESVTVRREVLALKGGYVQYERLDEMAKGIVGSMEERVFRACGPRLISNEPELAEPEEAPGDSIEIEFDSVESGLCFIFDPNLPELVIVPPIWGNGELPADHQEFFGNDNTARLDYVQNRVLDKHAAILKIFAIRVLALEGVDPNAIPVETRLARIEKIIGTYPPTCFEFPFDVNDPENTLLGAILAHTSCINQFRVQIDTNTERIEGISRLTNITYYDEHGKMIGGWDPNTSDSEMALLPVVEAVE